MLGKIRGRQKEGKKRGAREKRKKKEMTKGAEWRWGGEARRSIRARNE